MIPQTRAEPLFRIVILLILLLLRVLLLSRRLHGEGLALTHLLGDKEDAEVEAVDSDDGFTDVVDESTMLTSRSSVADKDDDVEAVAVAATANDGDVDGDDDDVEVDSAVDESRMGWSNSAEADGLVLLEEDDVTADEGSITAATNKSSK